MDEKDIKNLLELATQQEASDVHLVTGKPPLFRVHGELKSMQTSSLSAADLKQMIFGMLTEKQKQLFQDTRELDFSYSCMTGFQFRVNLHLEKSNLAATIRITPAQIKTREKLGLPPAIDELARKRKGLIIASGTAGSGKSTTINYIINLINQERKGKIVTVEDPIEYVHQSQQSLVIQREVGSDTKDFATALKYALRQDPDVVVVGEMRDLESIAMALTTAETGHLVLTTVHAPDSVETINRIIDVFPMGYREQICAQLAGNLIAVISQTLVPRKGEVGRVLATEIMVATTAIRNLVRRGALVEIRGQLDSEEETGMHSLERCLSDMYKQGVITIETAREYAKYPELLKLSDSTEFQKPSGREKDAGHSALSFKIKETKKILIIEKNEEDRKSISGFLQKYGFSNITFCQKGKEGLDKVKVDKPDIVVADLSLMDIDGFSICRQIKAFDTKIKVILVTGRLDMTDAASAKEAGADDFVIKTTTFDLLCKSVEKVCTI